MTKNIFKRSLAAFLIITISISFCLTLGGCSKQKGKTDPAELNEAQLSVMERYPEYFGLDCSNGLDVYVWQFAEGHYRFGLLTHSGPIRNMLSQELMELHGASAEDMRVILSTYDVDQEKIYIIPWQNPLSSYLASWQIVLDGQDAEANKLAYIKDIRKMLFEDMGN